MIKVHELNEVTIIRGQMTENYREMFTESDRPCSIILSNMLISVCPSVLLSFNVLLCTTSEINELID